MKKYENVIKTSITPSEITTFEIKNIINGIETILKNDVNNTMRTKPENLKIAFDDNQNQYINYKEDQKNIVYSKDWTNDGVGVQEQYNNIKLINNDNVNSKKNSLNPNNNDNNFTLNKETKFFHSKIKGLDNNYKIYNDLSNSNINLGHELANKSGLNDGFLDITPLPQESFKNNNLNDDQVLINENDFVNTSDKFNIKIDKNETSREIILKKKSEFYEIQDSENKSKILNKSCFEGRDLVDRIYSCPQGNIIELNSLESESISYLLIGF